MVKLQYYNLYTFESENFYDFDSVVLNSFIRVCKRFKIDFTENAPHTHKIATYNMRKALDEYENFGIGCLEYLAKVYKITPARKYSLEEFSKILYDTETDVKTQNSELKEDVKNAWDTKDFTFIKNAWDNFHRDDVIILLLEILNQKKLSCEEFLALATLSWELTSAFIGKLVVNEIWA